MSYSTTAYELLKVIPLTVPKKYRTRLKEISDRTVIDRDKWSVLIEELKHNCNQTEEISRLLHLNQEWEEAEEKRKEKERLDRINREERELFQWKENERIRKENKVKEQNESKARMAAAQDTLFGCIIEDDDVDIEPYNVTKHTFNQCSTEGADDPIVSATLVINNCPRYNPSIGQYVHCYDSHHLAK